MLSFAWLDKDRRQFTETCSSLRPDVLISKHPVQHVDTTCEAAPSANYVSMKQTQAFKMCFDYCGTIDQHNRARQDDLSMEKKIGLHDLTRQVNLGIFSMCC